MQRWNSGTRPNWNFTRSDDSVDMHHSEMEAQVEFPSLPVGVTLLAMEGRATGALQSLVLDHLLLEDGGAVWVDARNNAATTTLARIAPSRRILDRIQVARGFTPYQHYAIVEDIDGALTPETSLLVLPEVDWFYTGDEVRDGEGETMLTDVLDRVGRVAANNDLAAVVTRHQESGLGSQIEAAVDERIDCTPTSFGPRFSGSEFETLVYDCGATVQTTLAFWRRVLEARHPEAVADQSVGVTAIGSN